MTMMISPDPILRSSLGVADTIVLFLLALVVFGPKRLPEIGRQIGKIYGEFRRASNEFKFQIEDEMRKSEDEEKQKKLAAEPSTPQILPPATGQTIARGATDLSDTPEPLEASAESIEQSDSREAVADPVHEEVQR